MNFRPAASARVFVAAALAVATLMSATASYGAKLDRHVRIINETSHTMESFFASNVDTESWEEDILGRETLPPGADVLINIDDGTGHCLYDFKAVFDDGSTLIKYNVNVCEIGAYRYTE